MISSAIGRAAEQQQVREGIQRTLAGRGTTVVVEGAVDVGKSTLLNLAAEESARLGLDTVYGSADEFERGMPFAIFRSCAPGGGAPGSVLEAGIKKEMRRGADSGDSYRDARVFEGVQEVVAERCARTPVAVVLDDIQWCDQASVHLVRKLAMLSRLHPLFLLLASRTISGDAAGQLLSRLRTDGTLVLSLGALPEHEIADMVRNVTGNDPDGQLVELLTAAGGNPKHVHELISALTADGAIDTSDGAAHLVRPDPHPLPTFARVVRQRWARAVPADVFELVSVAAALGPVIDICELSAVTRLNTIDLASMLRMASASGVFVHSDQRITFCHELVREALLAEYPDMVRMAMRRDGVRGLIHAGASVEHVGDRLLACDPLDSSGMEWLRRAADALVARAPRTAAVLTERALAQELLDDALVNRFRLAHVDALLRTADFPDAETAARESIDRGPDGETEDGLRWRIALACFYQNRITDALTEVEHALTSSSVTTQLAADLHRLGTQCRFLLGHDVLAEMRTPSSGSRTRASSHGGGPACDLFVAGCAHLAEANPKLALDNANRAIEVLADNEIDIYRPALPELVRACALAELNHTGAADTVLRDALHRAGTYSHPYRAWRSAIAARISVVTGQWEQAIQQVRNGYLAGAGEQDNAALRCIESFVALRRGERAAPSVPFDECETGALQCLGELTEALRLETHGELRAAVDKLFAAWAPGADPAASPFVPLLSPDLVRMAADIGEPEFASAMAYWIRGVDDRDDEHGFTALHDLCTGTAEGDTTVITRAAERFRRDEQQLHYAIALETLAHVACSFGRVDEARQALRSADAAYVHQGAELDSARVSARMRTLGVQRGVRGPRQRPKSGWQALTDTELRIARFVAQGHSNPTIGTQMYLSRRTVQAHVSSILRKLGLSSRVEVAVELVRNTPESTYESPVTSR